MKHVKTFEEKLNENFKKPEPPKYLFSYKKLETAIKRSEDWLIKQANKNGLWEDFGQDVIRELEDTYIDISTYTDEMNRNRNILQKFNNWCMNFEI